MLENSRIAAQKRPKLVNFNVSSNFLLMKSSFYNRRFLVFGYALLFPGVKLFIVAVFVKNDSLSSWLLARSLSH